MTHAIRFHEYGGPEVLKWETVEVGEPGPGEARVRHEAVGVNFVDTYQRSGLYKVPLPSGTGNEGAGVVEAVGPGVTGVRPGDRVAYADGPGTYCEARIVPADRLVVLPEGISFEQGAAMMLKGMTVQYLIRRTYRVQPGDAVLFHAAAGGVGTIACQWLRHLGAVVIATAGSPEKCAAAIRHGADHCIDYRTENVVERVREITNGEGVAVAYDSVGKDTLRTSLDCLRPFGMFVSFGNASGPVPPLDLGLLRGSLFVARPSLFAYTAKRADLEAMAAELFDIVLSGAVRIEIGWRHPLQDAAQAHRDLESRATTASGILLP
ncbi:MAG TPA: quinone oxidoreductase [Candidatus Deferrimicrobiaceae bacterium]